MRIKTADLIGPALDWAVEEAIGYHASRPERCFDCKHHEERAIRDGSEHYCWHLGSDYLQWDSNGGGPYFGDGISSDHGTHRLCPINALTPDPYSTDWAQGGPIIDREKISVWETCLSEEYEPWSAITDIKTWGVDDTQQPHPERDESFGPTPLIAAMRCYVASKLGDEVEVPDALLS